MLSVNEIFVDCWLFITALVRILSRKNMTAIDHLLRWVVKSVVGNTIWQVVVTAALSSLQPIFIYENLVQLMIEQITPSPPAFLAI